jgi:hypothetical protein
MSVDRWIPCVKGNRKGYEISVVRTSFKHGRNSYGWFGKDKKLIVASSDYSSHDGLPTERAFRALVQVAKDMAAELNVADAS